MSRRTAGAAVAAATALAAALMFLVVPAVASGGTSRPGHTGQQVQVHRFVVRDNAGHVVARGATAWLPGHRTAATTTRQPTARVATAQRGQGVVVRHVAVGSNAPATATR